MATLNRNSQNKQKVIDKMSIYIKMYAKQNKVAKYVIAKKMKDSLGLSYDMLLLEKNKLFKHTSFFKKYKREYQMMTKSGTILPEFYTHLNVWFTEHHPDYMIAEDIIYKFFNDEENFNIEDLRLFNKLYKKLKHGIKQS